MHINPQLTCKEIMAYKLIMTVVFFGHGRLNLTLFVCLSCHLTILMLFPTL